MANALSKAVTMFRSRKSDAQDVKNEKLGTIFSGDDGASGSGLPELNSPDEDTLLRNIMQDYTVFRAARQMQQPIWQEEQRYYMGDHWFGIRSRESSRMSPDAVDNIAWSQIESMVGKMSAWNPWPDFQAQEQQDEEKASDLNAYMPYELNQIKFKQKYVTALRQCFVHGPLVFKVLFDPDVEGGTGINRYEGRNDIVPVDLGTFFPDPRITDFIYMQDMGAIIVHTRRTLEYFQHRWPKKGKDVQSDNIASDVLIYTYPNYGMAQGTFNFTDTTWYPYDASTQNQTAGLLEYWYRGLPKMMTDEDKQLFKEQAEMLLAQGKDPSEALAKAAGTMDGIHCVYVAPGSAGGGSVFLEHKSYVYDHGKYPFVARTLFPNGRNVWGKGFMRDMIRPQRMLNKYAEIAIEAMAKGGNSAIAYEEGAITKPGTWKDQRSVSGALLPVAPGRMNDWKELAPVEAPQTAMNMLKYYQEMLQKIPGIFDSANGAPNPNITSGEQAKAYMAAASTRLNTVSDLISEALSEVFSQYLCLMAQFYTDTRIARVTGRNVAISRGTIVNQAPTLEMDERGNQLVEEYVPEFDIMVNITAEKPQDYQYNLQLATQMLQMTDPITGLPMMDAEGVYYVIQNGRMENIDVIQKRIEAKSQREQQFQQVQQDAQQLAMQNQALQQQYAELAQAHEQAHVAQAQQQQEQQAFDNHIKATQLQQTATMNQQKLENERMKTLASLLPPQGGEPNG
jgi:hypothetical protein